MVWCEGGGEMKFKLNKVSSLLNSNKDIDVDIRTIKQLMKLRKDYGEYDLIIGKDRITIYDDYME
jgi:hypothetical protein